MFEEIKEGSNGATQVLMRLCHFFGHPSPKHHQVCRALTCVLFNSVQQVML